MALRVLDPARLASVPMIALVGHWSGGGLKANALDLRSYHTLTEGDGTPRYGVDIRLNSGRLGSGYAAHTKGANTNRIGHSMCGMMGAVERPFNPGSAPLTKVQWDRHVLAAADLCEVYRIAVARDKTLFHAEVQGTLGIAQSAKWDVAVLPFDRSISGARAIGDRFRDELLAALRGNGPSLPQGEPLPAGIIGGTGIVTAAKLNARIGPGTQFEQRGEFPAGTPLTILEADGDWLQVRSPNGIVRWVHGGYVRLLDTAPLPNPTVPDPVHVQFAALRARLDEIEVAIPEDRASLATTLARLRGELSAF